MDGLLAALTEPERSGLQFKSGVVPQSSLIQTNFTNSNIHVLCFPIARDGSFKKKIPTHQNVILLVHMSCYLLAGLQTKCLVKSIKCQN